MAALIYSQAYPAVQAVTAAVCYNAAKQDDPQTVVNHIRHKNKHGLQLTW